MSPSTLTLNEVSQSFNWVNKKPAEAKDKLSHIMNTRRRVVIN